MSWTARVDEDGVLSVVAKALEALAAAHADGEVHGNLTPDHLVVHGDEVSLHGLGDAWLDADELAIAAYLAPERLVGAAVDGRADLYSLGAIMHRTLGDGARCAPIIRKAMALDPSDRYADAAAMRSEIALLLADKTRTVAVEAAWSDDDAPTRIEGRPHGERDARRRDDVSPGLLIADRYLILGKLGEGGMGTVYEGRHVRTQRRVAVKVLRARSREAQRRFELEAQAAAKIGSEHIVDALDFGQLEDGSPYMVMELCEGESLSARIERRGTLSPDELLPIIEQLLEGLAAAHDASIVHRDLKPANIFLLEAQPGRAADFVKILDFGISLMQESDDDSGILGTPTYMAPEQARGADVDLRADIYAVGVIMYRALSGRRPFGGDDPDSYLAAVLAGEPAPLEGPLSAVVMKALAHDRTARYADAHALARAFARALGQKPRSRRWLRWAAAALLLYPTGWLLYHGGATVVLATVWPSQPVSVRALDPPPEARLVTIDDGVCLLDEMIRAERMCLMPVVDADVETPNVADYRLIASFDCNDLQNHFGAEAVAMTASVPCHLQGVWSYLDEHERDSVRALPNLVPGLPQRALVVDDLPELMGLGGLLLFGAGALGLFMMWRLLRVMLGRGEHDDRPNR